MMNNPQDALLQQLDAMSSEARNPDSWDIDLLSSLEIVQRINAEDQTVAHSLQSCLSDVAAVADVEPAAAVADVIAMTTFYNLWSTVRSKNLTLLIHRSNL